MRVEPIEDAEGLAALRDTWTDIVAAGGTATPCLTWEWVHAWWRYYGENDARRRLAVLVAYEGSAATAILPAFVAESRLPGLRLRTLAFLGTPHESGSYLEPIQRDRSRPDLAAVLMSEARERWAPDCLYLDGVLRGDAAAERLAGWARDEGISCRTTTTHVSPYLPISGPWRTYEAGLDSELRRRTRRFFDRPGAAFTWVRDRDEIRSAVETLFVLHGQRFAQKRARTGFAGARRRAFHTLVSELLFDRDILRLFRLTVDGRTVATQYCFEHGRQLFYYQGGMDPTWGRAGVGAVLTGQIIKYAFDRGLTLFDFMRGAQPYKLQWTSHVRDLVRLDVGVTPRGLVAAAMPSVARWLRG